MRYTLWSRGRLVGHTGLDVYTITPTMRQGFVEPTEEGSPLLADATGVWRAMAEVKRDARARGDAGKRDNKLVMAAMERREALNFELRDESGAVFECDFIRITDLFDLERVTTEMSDTEEEEEAAFQIHLSALSGDALDEALAQRAEMNREIEEAVAQIREERDENNMFGSGWPLIPEDPRWDTMQYLLQAHLKSNDWEAPGYDE